MASNSMPDEKILAIAKQNKDEGFRVSLRYRDENLMRRCRKMVRDGKLVGGRRDGDGCFFYYAVKASPATQEETQ